jgi:DNA-binding transcriptional LysR family regulator
MAGSKDVMSDCKQPEVSSYNTPAAGTRHQHNTLCTFNSSAMVKAAAAAAAAAAAIAEMAAPYLHAGRLVSTLIANTSL